MTIDLACKGDPKALEELIKSIQDMIFNLSLRMLGSPQDAEDASQDIILKIIIGLNGFRKESSFSTWVYRIAVNSLINYKKSMFSQHPLSFEFYGEDIRKGYLDIQPELLHNVDEHLLAEELKASCTNVMLQCLDAESRCIFVLGTMFRLDSKVAGEILNISPEVYRKRLSRIRKKVADFIKEYCGLGNGYCNCYKRVGYAISNHRLSPNRLEYMNMDRIEEDRVDTFVISMERLDEISQLFYKMPRYKNPKPIKEFMKKVMDTKEMSYISKEW